MEVPSFLCFFLEASIHVCWRVNSYKSYIASQSSYKRTARRPKSWERDISSQLLSCWSLCCCLDSAIPTCTPSMHLSLSSIKQFATSPPLTFRGSENHPDSSSKLSERTIQTVEVFCAYFLVAAWQMTVSRPMTLVRGVFSALNC